jgi:hypothetical protein
MFAVGLTMGCRGSNPFGRFVQVSKTPDAGLPDIQAPPQRLATAKPRVEVEAVARPTRQSANRRLADDSPHVTQASSREPAGTETDRRGVAPKGRIAQQTQRSDSERSRSSAKRSPSKNSLASTSSQSKSRSKAAASKTNTAKRAAQAPVDHFSEDARNTTKQSAKKRESTAAKRESVAVDDSDQAELMAKFTDYPPEVQKEALRRLVEATSRSAERTKQPNSLEKQLAGIAELPKLPKLRNSKPEVPPTRLAADQTGPLPSADIMQSDSNPGSLTLPLSSDSVTDLLTTELESVVKRASDAMAEATEVQTASASRDGDESDLIARASVEEPTLQLTDQKKPSTSDEIVKKAEKVEDDGKKDPVVIGTDQELYSILLKRLSTAAPGESEAERSSRLIKLRHLMVLAGNPDDAVAQIEGMSKSEQEYLRHQLLGLWTMIDPDGHPIASRRFSTAVPQIREAAKFAAAATDTLEVRSLAFCTEIESYGQIKPFPGNRFNPGQQVIMYCEIENFTAKKTDDGFETNLQGSYDIYDSEGEKVISQLLPADQQVSSNYLRDYFIAYQMHLPQQLEGGTYRMQLTMEDVNGKKYGQTSIPFEIAK